MGHGCANWVRYWGSIRRLVTSVVYCQIFFLCPKILNNSFPLLSCFTTFELRIQRLAFCIKCLQARPPPRATVGPMKDGDRDDREIVPRWVAPTSGNVLWHVLKSWEFLGHFTGTELNWVELAWTGWLWWDSVRFGEGSCAEPRELPMPCQFQRLHQDRDVVEPTVEPGEPGEPGNRVDGTHGIHGTQNLFQDADDADDAGQFLNVLDKRVDLSNFQVVLSLQFLFLGDQPHWRPRPFHGSEGGTNGFVGNFVQSVKVLRDFKTYCVLLWDSGLQACQWACRLCTWHDPVTLPCKGRSLQFAGCREKA